MFEFKLGDKVKDYVTGFTGVVVGRTEWLNGCIRYAVQPTTLKDGAPQDVQHIDEQQILIVKPKTKKTVQKRTGGARKDPSRGQISKR